MGGKSIDNNFIIDNLANEYLISGKSINDNLITGNLANHNLINDKLITLSVEN